mmetsp:Transcript_118084/g.252298  ORF Transcript_118084/g.252298 Transcript_118084/m.252298 type:complete len:248 (+) Transcript_118084:334-1077(+)
MKGMATRSDLDHLMALPGCKADGALCGILLALLVAEESRVVETCHHRAKCTWWSSAAILLLKACGLPDDLALPIYQEEAQNTDKATVQSIHLEVVVKMRIVDLAARGLHDLDPKQRRANAKHIERTVQHHVHDVHTTEPLRSRLHVGDAGSNARQKARQPHHRKADEVHRESIRVVSELILVVLAEIAGGRSGVFRPRSDDKSHQPKGRHPQSEESEHLERQGVLHPQPPAIARPDVEQTAEKPEAM